MSLGVQIRIYTDGGARGNPGPAAIGIVICDQDDRIIKEYKEYIGVATNNQAEYRAIIKGLKMATHLACDRILCISDSELIIRQLNNEYRVKNLELKALFNEVKRIILHFQKVEFEHRMRMSGLLKRADQLVNEILDSQRR